MSADSPAAVPYNSSGTEIATVANPVRTDPTGTTAQPVTDNGGTLTVDGTVTATVAAVGADNTAKPGSDILIGGSDGTNIQAARVFDADSGAGSQYVLGVQLRKSANGGSVEAGTSTNPLFNTMNQNVIASAGNSSIANLAAGATFPGASESTLGVAGIQVNCKASHPILVQIWQSPDGTNWDVSDEQTFMAGEGDGRTYQATASYFKVTATNVGGTTTSYLRLQTALCPTVEVVPRALTPKGRLRLASVTESWAPDPMNADVRNQHRALLMDTERNLNVRARCLTDEASFRDDFTAAEMTQDLTGTVYFTNGSNVVTGIGTLFSSEVSRDHYLKLSSHADSAYALVSEVVADGYLLLDSPYTGATGNGTGRTSYWEYVIETGGAITQTGSEILLASGTTSGTNVQAKRLGDYLPFVLSAKLRVTQRIANQESHIGVADGDIGSVQQQALVIFDGTDNTKCKLRTSFSSVDIEETTVTLPSGLVSSTSAYYQIEVLPNRVVLYVNDIKLAEHKLHIPAPYADMELHVCIKNTGTAGSTTTLAVDTYYFSNFDRVQIAAEPKGDPLSVKEQRAGTAALSNISAAVADTLVLAANQNRLGATIYNDSDSAVYLKLGSGASATSFTVKMAKNDYYEVPYGYLGQINGYWVTATGTARVTEVS